MSLRELVVKAERELGLELPINRQKIKRAHSLMAQGDKTKDPVESLTLYNSALEIFEEVGFDKVKGEDPSFMRNLIDALLNKYLLKTIGAKEYRIGIKELNAVIGLNRTLEEMGYAKKIEELPELLPKLSLIYREVGFLPHLMSEALRLEKIYFKHIIPLAELSPGAIFHQRAYKVAMRDPESHREVLDHLNAINKG